MEEKKTPESSEKKNIKEAVVGFFKKLSKKQLIAIISAVVVVAILVPVIILVAKDSGDDPHRKPNNPNNNVTTPGNGDNGNLPPLPDPVEFGTDDEPYTYNALVRTGTAGATEDQMLAWGNNYYAAIDFYATQADGEVDAISYAVYARNTKIEEIHKVRIKQTAQNGDMTAQLKLLYMNSEKIDLTIILARAAANAATQNLLSNLLTMSSLDLSHPSYDQKSIKELALGDCLYYINGDMNVSAMEVCGPTVVNLEMYSDYIETFVELFDNDPTYADIYSLVFGKKWTIDTMLTMATAINENVDDADGKPLGSQTGDILGYFAYTGMGVYYFYGSGGRLTEIDEDGIPTLVIEKHADLFDYLFDKFNTREGDNASWLPTGYSNDRWNTFKTGQCLFTDMTLYDIRKVLYDESPFQYGILPNPVWEEGTDYNSVVYFTNCNHLWAIPNMVNDS